VKVCGVAVAMPQACGYGPSPLSADRPGTGRSRRSTPSRGEPAHMGKGGSGKGMAYACLLLGVLVAVVLVATGNQVMGPGAGQVRRA
jgi:hypothetical protein